MPIREKISDKEWMLYEVLRHPILFGEFYRNLDLPKGKDEWEYSPYQKEYLGDFSPYVSLCCGRAVGKTVTLTDYILWIMINNIYPEEYILYTVPNKVHLEPVFFSLIRELRNNSLLKNFIAPKSGINSSNFTITLLNSSQLVCRIAGQSGTGANVVGLHTPLILLDEAGFYPWGTWVELQPVLNEWQEGHKLWISGVPTGLRENNVLYYADEVDDQFTKHRTSAHENPRYSEEMEQRNLQQYGGADSEDYVHLVLGRHGSPTFAVFDRRLLQIEEYATWITSINGIEIESYSSMVNRLALIPPVPKSDITIMGIDLGYTEPTSIMILYEKKGVIREHARINLYKVKYPIQEKIIDYLDTKFGQPQVIGIDVGNEKGLTQHLLADEIYLHKNYQKRLVPVSFGSWLSLGENLDGEEIKVKTKPYSVSLLQEYSNTHKIVYASTDMELITEMERMTYTKTPTGEIVYRTLTPKGGKRGDDHNTSAMLCATMAYFMLIDGRLFSKQSKPLARSRWVATYG
jgi:hypothetical protein